MDRFALLLSGRIEPTPGLRAALAGRRIIAADGGIAHAATLALVPELWVGDFDSVPDDLPAALAATKREAVPSDKDETDAELAAEAAIARGARDLLIVGGFGGPRSDHVFSNLVLAQRYAARGLRVELFDGREHAVPLGARPVSFACEPGTQFSILRFGDVEGLTVSGARWPLKDVDIPFASVLTQSNEALGPIEASVRRGEAALLVQAAPPQ